MPSSDSSLPSPDVPARTPQISTAMTVGRASWVMAAMIGLSRLTGFGRMMLVSHLYGNGPQAAVFEAAFNIPDTITILIAGGALATGFVPVFTAYLSRGETAAAIRTFRAMWTLLGLTFGAITLLLLALTYTPFIAWFAPQKVAPEFFPLYLQLLRILLLAQFFFVLGGLFAGTLNALRLFWYPALQPVMFNGGIIVLGILLPYGFGMGIESQAWGALLGAIVGSLLIQLPAVRRNGLSLKPLWDLNDPGVKKVLISLLPIVFGLASGQIIALNLPRFLAGAMLPESALPSIGYANRLMQVPLDLLASGPAIALYPTLSLLAAQNDTNALREQITGAIRRTVVLTMLATALLAGLRVPILHLLLEHGKFGPRETAQTAPVLACYALCVVGLGAQQILARGFYASGDTKKPVVIGLAAMGLFAFTALLAMTMWPLQVLAGGVFASGAARLAFCAAISAAFLSVAMYRALGARLGGWETTGLSAVIGKSLLCALVCLFVAQVVGDLGLSWESRNLTTKTPEIAVYLVRGLTVLVGTLAGASAFVVGAKLLKLPLSLPKKSAKVPARVS